CADGPGHEGQPRQGQSGATDGNAEEEAGILTARRSKKKARRPARFFHAGAILADLSSSAEQGGGSRQCRRTARHSNAVMHLKQIRISRSAWSACLPARTRSPARSSR